MFPSSKEVFLHNFRQFLENWFFDGNSTGADLTKIVKFCTLLNLYLGNIFWLNYLFPSSKEVFLHNFRQFLKKLNFYRKYDRREPYKNSEIFYSLKFVLRIYFLLNYLFPSSKEVFQSNLRQFLENWYFDGISTGADLTKIVKFCTL